MNVIGLMLVRNEAWVLPYSARAALQWVNRLIIMCHACQDETFHLACEVAGEHAGRVTVMAEANPDFDEMDFRQAMLRRARSLGGTVMALIDADEILTAHLIPKIRFRLELLPPGGVLVTPIHNLWRSLGQFRCDASPFGRAWVILAFRDLPEATWKPAADGYQFHHRIPQGNWIGPLRWPAERLEGGVMHLQHASWRRVAQKHRWYKVTEALRWPHKDRAAIQQLYAGALDETDLQTRAVPEHWWTHGLERALIDLEAVPWQEAAVNRMIAAASDRTVFAGLDLLEDPA